MKETSSFNPNLKANQSPLTMQKLEKMTPGQRNLNQQNKYTTDSYKQQVEEKFEESLQNKLDKIKDIFNKDAAPGDTKPENPSIGNPESIQRAA